MAASAPDSVQHALAHALQHGCTADTLESLERACLRLDDTPDCHQWIELATLLDSPLEDARCQGAQLVTHIAQRSPARAAQAAGDAGLGRALAGALSAAAAGPGASALEFALGAAGAIAGHEDALPGAALHSFLLALSEPLLDSLRALAPPAAPRGGGGSSPNSPPHATSPSPRAGAGARPTVPPEAARRLCCRLVALLAARTPDSGHAALARRGAGPLLRLLEDERAEGSTREEAARALGALLADPASEDEALARHPGLLQVVARQLAIGEDAVAAECAVLLHNAVSCVTSIHAGSCASALLSEAGSIPRIFDMLRRCSDHGTDMQAWPQGAAREAGSALALLAGVSGVSSGVRSAALGHPGALRLLVWALGAPEPSRLSGSARHVLTQTMASEEAAALAVAAASDPLAVHALLRLAHDGGGTEPAAVDNEPAGAAAEGAFAVCVLGDLSGHDASSGAVAAALSEATDAELGAVGEWAAKKRKGGADEKLLCGFVRVREGRRQACFDPAQAGLALIRNAVDHSTAAAASMARSGRLRAALGVLARGEDARAAMRAAAVMRALAKAKAAEAVEAAEAAVANTSASAGGGGGDEGAVAEEQDAHGQERDQGGKAGAGGLLKDFRAMPRRHGLGQSRPVLCP